MTPILRAVAGIVALSVSGPIAIAQDEPQPVYVKDLSCTEGPFRLHLPSTYQAVRAIGHLRDEKVIQVQSWEKYKTEDRQLFFDGLRLDVVTFSNDNTRYLVAGAVVTTSGWSFAGGFRVGQSIDTALSRLGAKTGARSEILLGGDADALRLGVNGGKVVRIAYECYTG